MRLFITLVMGFWVSLGWAEAKPPKTAACDACHGANGAAPIMNSYPKINGQNKDYLVAALKDYRAGNRKGPLSAIMTSQATGLSDADIEALAAYYAAQP